MTETPQVDNVTSSPLAEASPTSLDDLFNKDPLELTEEDLVRTVEYLRKARETFLAGEAGKVPKSAKGKSSSVPVKKIELDQTLTAADLDLDI